MRHPLQIYTVPQNKLEKENNDLKRKISKLSADNIRSLQTQRIHEEKIECYEKEIAQLRAGNSKLRLDYSNLQTAYSNAWANYEREKYMWNESICNLRACIDEQMTDINVWKSLYYKLHNFLSQEEKEYMRVEKGTVVLAESIREMSNTIFLDLNELPVSLAIKTLRYIQEEKTCILSASEVVEIQKNEKLWSSVEWLKNFLKFLQIKDGNTDKKRLQQPLVGKVKQCLEDMLKKLSGIVQQQFLFHVPDLNDFYNIFISCDGDVNQSVQHYKNHLSNLSKGAIKAFLGPNRNIIPQNSKTEDDEKKPEAKPTEVIPVFALSRFSQIIRLALQAHLIDETFFLKYPNNDEYGMPALKEIKKLFTIAAMSELVKGGIQKADIPLHSFFTSMKEQQKIFKEEHRVGQEVLSVIKSFYG